MQDFTLIFGNGWLGTRLASEFHGKAIRADITDRNEVEAAIRHFCPQVVINAAGRTGRPNIDSLEADPSGTLLVNTAGPLILAEECIRRGIYMVHLGSGCVYDNSRVSYTEEDPPNFFGSIYSQSKFLSEQALKNLPVLQLRIRMPFDGTPHPRNLITKLAGYKRIISEPNSITYIDDLVMAAGCLIAARKKGIWNVVASDGVTHPDIMKLYRQIVDPLHTFEEISLEELATLTRAGRSNCILDTDKLSREGIKMKPSLVALTEAMLKYRGKL
jgi:dTDP-4-dehydrorhamnose reductase